MLHFYIRERSLFMAEGGGGWDLFSEGGDFLKHIMKGGVNFIAYFKTGVGWGGGG